MKLMLQEQMELSHRNRMLNLPRVKVNQILQRRLLGKREKS